jgi:hypothetical protein
MIANSSPATAKPGTGGGRLARTPQVVAVTAIGAGLVLAIVGVGVIAAVGKTVPTQLWDVITALSGAVLGMLIPSPAQRRAVQTGQQHMANVLSKLSAAGQAKQTAADRANQAAGQANAAADKARQAALKMPGAAAAEADQAKQAADQAKQEADQAQQAADQAAEAAAAQATQAADEATKTTAGQGGGGPDVRIAFAALLAAAAAAGATLLYGGPGQDSQCLASVGTLTTTVVQPAGGTGTTASGGVPANIVTNVSTLTIGQITTPLPTTTSGSATIPTGTPQIVKTATGPANKCPAVSAGDSLMALTLGVLAAILGILVPSFKPFPETTETPAP